MEYVMSLVHVPGPKQFSLNPDAASWLSVCWHSSLTACPCPTVTAQKSEFTKIKLCKTHQSTFTNIS